MADRAPRPPEPSASREASATDQRIGRLELALVVLLIAMGVRTVWSSTVAPAAGIDYFQFWLVGRAEHRTEVGNVYSATGREVLLQVGRELRAANPKDRRLSAAVAYRSNIETFSTPLLYLAIDALATGDYDFDFRAFTAVGLACLGVAVALLGRRAGLSCTATALALLTLLMCSDPLLGNVETGNINALQLAAIAIYLALLRGKRPSARRIVAGVVLGLLVSFKPTLGLILPYVCLGWLARRRLRPILEHCIGVAAGATAAILASSLFLRSPRAWLDWVASLSDLTSARERSISLGNFSVSRWIGEVTGVNVSLPVAVVTIVGTAAVVWFANRTPRSVASGRAPDADVASGDGKVDDWSDFVAVALAAAVSVVALQLAWLHYYLLLVPLAIAVLRRRVGQGVVETRATGPRIQVGGFAGRSSRVSRAWRSWARRRGCCPFATTCS